MEQLFGLLVHAGSMLFVSVVVLSRFLEIMASVSRDAWDAFVYFWGDKA